MIFEKKIFFSGFVIRKSHFFLFFGDFDDEWTLQSRRRGQTLSIHKFPARADETTLIFDHVPPLHQQNQATLRHQSEHSGRPLASTVLRSRSSSVQLPCPTLVVVIAYQELIQGLIQGLIRGLMGGRKESKGERERERM